MVEIELEKIWTPQMRYYRYFVERRQYWTDKHFNIGAGFVLIHIAVIPVWIANVIIMIGSRFAEGWDSLEEITILTTIIIYNSYFIACWIIENIKSKD